MVRLPAFVAKIKHRNDMGMGTKPPHGLGQKLHIGQRAAHGPGARARDSEAAQKRTEAQANGGG